MWHAGIARDATTARVLALELLAAQAFRETLQRATLAAEALALPERAADAAGG